DQDGRVGEVDLRLGRLLALRRRRDPETQPRHVGITLERSEIHNTRARRLVPLPAPEATMCERARLPPGSRNETITVVRCRTDCCKGEIVPQPAAPLSDMHVCPLVNALVPPVGVPTPPPGWVAVQIH